MAVVPGVLLDHVGVDPAQRQRAAAPAGELIVQRCPGHRPAGQVAFLGKDREVGLGPVRVGLLEGRVLVRLLGSRSRLSPAGQKPFCAWGRQRSRVRGDNVIVATNRSPTGQPVPIEWVQSGLEQLLETGEIEVSVPSLGHRSSFVGAVLLTLPGAVLIRTAPPRIRLNQSTTGEC